MDESSREFQDAYLFETTAYAREYLEILIQKYVDTEEEFVDIDIRTLKFFGPPSDNFKRNIKKKFGFVSSWDCEFAQKTIKYHEEKIINKKRRSNRNKVCAKSSRSADGKSDGSSFSSDTAKSVSKRKQKVFSETKADKSLTTYSKKYPLRTNGVPQFSNPHKTVSQSNDYEQVEVLIPSKSNRCGDIYNNCDDDTYKLVVSNIKSSISSTNQNERRESNHFTLRASSLSSLNKYVSSMTVKPRKGRFNDIGLSISSKAHQVPTICYSESLADTVSEVEASETKVGKSKNYPKNLSNGKSLAYVSSKPTVLSKIKVSERKESSKIHFHALSISIGKSLSLSSIKPPSDTEVKETEMPQICPLSRSMSDGKSSSSKSSISSKTRYSKTEMESSKNDYKDVRFGNSKSSCVSSSDTLPSKMKFSETELEKPKENCRRLLSMSDGKSSSNKSSISSKTRYSKTEMENSKNDYKDVSIGNSKSLCVSSRGTLPSKMKFSETELEKPKENCQRLSKSSSSESASHLSPLRSSFRMSRDLNALTDKKLLNNTKTCKKKSLVQSTTPLQRSKSNNVHKLHNHPENYDIPIDDLCF